MKKFLILMIAVFQITAVFPSYAQSTERYTVVSGDRTNSNGFNVKLRKKLSKNAKVRWCY